MKRQARWRQEPEQPSRAAYEEKSKHFSTGFGKGWEGRTVGDHGGVADERPGHREP